MYRQLWGLRCVTVQKTWIWVRHWMTVPSGIRDRQRAKQSLVGGECATLHYWSSSEHRRWCRRLPTNTNSECWPTWDLKKQERNSFSTIHVRSDALRAQYAHLMMWNPSEWAWISHRASLLSDYRRVAVIKSNLKPRK